MGLLPTRLSPDPTLPRVAPVPSNLVAPPHRLAPTDRLAPAILLTFDGWIVGHLVDSRGRIIDTLAGRSTIAMMTPEGYREIDRDLVLLIVPPPSPSRLELRVAKRRIPVSIDIHGVAMVRGNCHVLPGASAWVVWDRSPSGFAALTEAVLEFPDGHAESTEAVLISRRAATAGLRIG